MCQLDFQPVLYLISSLIKAWIILPPEFMLSISINIEHLFHCLSNMPIWCTNELLMLLVRCLGLAMDLQTVIVNPESASILAHWTVAVLALVLPFFLLIWNNILQSKLSCCVSGKIMSIMKTMEESIPVYMLPRSLFCEELRMCTVVFLYVYL